MVQKGDWAFGVNAALPRNSTISFSSLSKVYLWIIQSQSLHLMRSVLFPNLFLLTSPQMDFIQKRETYSNVQEWQQLILTASNST